MNINNTFWSRSLKSLTLILITGSIAILYSCGNDDEPTPENEEELITTLTMTFSNIIETTDVVVAQFRDIDGEGGQPPTFIQPTLKANGVYNAEIELLNESVTPPTDISAEVLEEGTQHQFFFSSSDNSLLSFSYLDSDRNGFPIGLSTRWELNDTGTATFVVILRHMPDKDATGVSDGGIANAEGNTDIEVSFDLTIE